MRILIADDSEINLALLERILEKLGHQVTACKNGTEVMDYHARGELPQLLILDWMMPGLDGVEVCRQLREDKTLPYTHVIMLTSKSESADVVTGLRSGVN